MSHAHLPGFAYVDHIGLNVPNLDEAVGFFVEALGAEELYRTRREGPRALMEAVFETEPGLAFEIAMLRLPPNLNIELFEWNRPATTSPPQAEDAGGHHLCFYVDDVADARAFLLQRPGVRALGEVNEVRDRGPLAGTRWAYLEIPWGLRIEIVERERVERPPAFVRFETD